MNNICILLVVFVLVNVNCFDSGDQIQHKAVKQCIEVVSYSELPRPSIQYEVSSGEPFVMIRNAVTDADFAAIENLEICIKEHMPFKAESRSFKSVEELDGSEQDSYFDGNEVVYMTGFFNVIFESYLISYTRNHNLMQNLLPDLYSHLLAVGYDAGATANIVVDSLWLNLRCAEVLTYHTDSKLKWHIDEDSEYTMIVFLSERSQYTGGELVVSSASDMHELSSGQNFTIPGANKGDVVLLKSHSPHMVTMLESGTRRVFAMELWKYFETSVDDFRPAPMHDPQLRFEEEEGKNNQQEEIVCEDVVCYLQALARS
jgi:hypothetical protein